MKDLTGQNFGYLIAYLLPGFVVVIALSEHSAVLRGWLGANAAEAGTTVGGFLYATLAATAAGLIASTLRWLALDALHHATGLVAPRMKFANLGSRVAAFEYLNEIHYRYYQFYGNTLVALAVVYAADRLSPMPSRGGWLDLGFAALESLLFLGSRDALRKYYFRASELLSAKDR